MSVRTVKSCGVVLFTRRPSPRFLLMKHLDRWDLPKGQVDPGESDLDCALREFEEETGIHRSQIELDPAFRFEEVYHPVDRRGARVEKTLILFLGWIDEPCDVTPTEHVGAAWFDWTPPHAIQSRTIDPVLEAIRAHLDLIGEARRA